MSVVLVCVFHYEWAKLVGVLRYMDGQALQNGDPDVVGPENDRQVIRECFVESSDQVVFGPGSNLYNRVRGVEAQPM